MWRYLPGVSIPNKKDVKEIPQKADSREYEKTRSRKFSSKRQVGRPLLKDDENSMTCEWCMENKQTLISQSVLTSSKFIDGCTSYKAESIAYHENSAAHKLASQYHKAKQNSEKNPRIFGQATRLQLALRSRWGKRIDTGKNTPEHQRLYDIHETHRNNSLGSSCWRKKKAKFVSVTSDGATDASITEQEIVFVCYSSKGEPVTKFAGLRQPVSPDATGLFQAIMEALEDVGLNTEELAKKLVGFDCDGASVMVVYSPTASTCIVLLTDCSLHSRMQ